MAAIAAHSVNPLLGLPHIRHLDLILLQHEMLVHGPAKSLYGVDASIQGPVIVQGQRVDVEGFNPPLDITGSERLDIGTGNQLFEIRFGWRFLAETHVAYENGKG